MTKKISKNIYENKLDIALNKLHSEGRYRTFIEIERDKGNFPSARWLSEKNHEKSVTVWCGNCLLYTSPSPRDVEESRMPSSA